VKLGLALPSFVEDPEIPLAVARAADAAGLDGVFVYDHLFRLEHGTRRPALEGVSLLGAVAAATSNVAVGALVFRAWLRPPATLAAVIATMLRIAPGRLIAAIGAGDSQSREENESFGLGFGTMRDRVDALRAAVTAAQAGGARIWVGGRAKAVRQVAAEQAHGWNAWGGDVDVFASQVADTRAMGVSPDFDCTWGGLVVLGEDDARARAKAERLGASDQAIVGGPATVATALARYGAVGADWLIVAPLDSRDPQNARLLAEQVKPLLGD